MDMHNRQEWLEEKITERLLTDRLSPHDALQSVMADPDAPDPMEAVFALTTVAADLSGWQEAGLFGLSNRCFAAATLFICELWAEGYRLEPPEE
ncbi:hypothetical protein [uncultured Celeribacter sp.]|uniref:hypothetical protein n=1 Tax=uncultured Celeribacter sp. TaxID=1303376 RepID=UPI00374870F9